MTSLSDLYGTIDRLDHTELQQLRTYIDQRMEYSQTVSEDAQAKVKALQDAVENFWEGMGQEEIDEIVEAMNSEYIEPLSEYDWLDEADKT